MSKKNKYKDMPSSSLPGAPVEKTEQEKAAEKAAEAQEVKSETLNKEMESTQKEGEKAAKAAEQRIVSLPPIPEAPPPTSEK